MHKSFIKFSNIFQGKLKNKHLFILVYLGKKNAYVLNKVDSILSYVYLMFIT